MTISKRQAQRALDIVEATEKARKELGRFFDEATAHAIAQAFLYPNPSPLEEYAAESANHQGL